MSQENFTLQDGKVGMLVTSEYGKVGSKLNPLVAHVWTATVGGSATDGVYSFILKQDSEDAGATITVTRSTTPSSNTDLATALAAYGETLAALRNVAAFTSAAAVVTVTAIQFGTRFDLTDATAPSPGTLVLANSVDSAGTTIPVGRCVVKGSAENELALPGSTSNTANVVGITFWGAEMVDNSGDDWQVDGYAPGVMVPVNNEIPEWVQTEETVAEGGLVYVRRIASSIQNLGEFRASGDGTARVETVTPTAVNDQNYQLQLSVDRDGNGNFESYTLASLGDGSATATEICDDYRTQLAAITELTGVVTGSGTATFIMTGAAGVEFGAVDLGPGVSAVVETTAGTFETFQLRNARFASDRTGSGRVKIEINLPRV